MPRIRIDIIVRTSRSLIVSPIIRMIRSPRYRRRTMLIIVSVSLSSVLPIYRFAFAPLRLENRLVASQYDHGLADVSH